MAGEELIDRMSLITPDSTTGEGLSAAVGLAQFDTFMDSFISGMQLGDLKDGDSSTLDFTKNKGKIIPRDELNEMYPNLEVPFTQDMNEHAAFLINDRSKQKRALNEKINAGPDNMFYGVAKFGAQVIPHALDPVELGSGILGGYLLGGAAAAVGGIEALGLTATGRAAATATTFQKFLAASADGIIGNVLVEPVVANNSGNYQEDYTINDSFMNVVAGAVAFPAMLSAGKLSINMFRHGTNPISSFASNINVKANDILYRSAFGQALQGRSPELHSIISSYINDIEVKSDADLSGIKRVNSDTFFVSAYEKGRPISESKSEMFFDDFGGDIHIIDDPDIASKASTRELNDFDGEVIEVRRPKNAKTLDLDKTLDGDLKASVIKILDEVVEPSKLEGVSGKDALSLIKSAIAEERIDPDSLATIKEDLMSKGYTDYTHDASTFMGEKRSPTRTHVMFDRNSLEEVGRHEAKRSKAPNGNTEVAKKLAADEQSLNRNMYHNEESLQRQVDTSVEIKEPTRPQIEAETEAYLTELEGLGIDPRAVREELGILKKAANLTVDMINLTKFCVGGK